MEINKTAHETANHALCKLNVGGGSQNITFRVKIIK